MSFTGNLGVTHGGIFIAHNCDIGSILKFYTQNSKKYD
jgi:hypothetical protein